jgi:hypothetical protein
MDACLCQPQHCKNKQIETFIHILPIFYHEVSYESVLIFSYIMRKLFIKWTAFELDYFLHRIWVSGTKATYSTLVKITWVGIAFGLNCNCIGTTRQEYCQYWKCQSVKLARELELGIALISLDPESASGDRVYYILYRQRDRENKLFFVPFTLCPTKGTLGRSYKFLSQDDDVDMRPTGRGIEWVEPI